MTDVLLVVALLLTAGAGTAVALTRDPVSQCIVLGAYGLLLSLLFVLLQAPDVALSEVGVNGIALPTLILYTLVKLKRRRGPSADPSGDAS
jgi:uncharacterized MnhB-related membrane protein